MPINLFGDRENEYRLVLVQKVEDNTYDLLRDDISIVKSIQITEEVDSPIVECTIELLMTADFRLVENGDMLLFSCPALQQSGEITVSLKHIFHIFQVKLNDKRGTLTLIARNLGHWMENGNFFLKVKRNETASTFIERTALESSMPVANIQETRHKLTSRVFQGNTLYEAWLSVMTTTMSEENKSLRLKVEPKGVSLEYVQLGLSSAWLFEQTPGYSNLMDLERVFSIIHPAFANVIRGSTQPNQGIGGGGGGVLGFATANFIEKENSDSVRKYGTFFATIDPNDYDTQRELDAVVNKMLIDKGPIEIVTFSIPAINSLQPLDRFMLNSNKLGSGLFFINSLQTFYKNGYWGHRIKGTKKTNIPEVLLREIEDNGALSGISF